MKRTRKQTNLELSLLTKRLKELDEDIGGRMDQRDRVKKAIASLERPFLKKFVAKEGSVMVQSNQEDLEKAHRIVDWFMHVDGGSEITLKDLEVKIATEITKNRISPEEFNKKIEELHLMNVFLFDLRFGKGFLWKILRYFYS